VNYIDLFAGASGMSEGFVRSGFNPIAHIEMDSEACSTIRTRAAYHYLKSIDQKDLYYDYISGKIDRETLYKAIPSYILDSVLNIEISDDTVENSFNIIKDLLKQQKEKTIDLIIGGPPCQAYSLIGRHQIDVKNDPRTLLYQQYGKYLDEFKPKVFVFENVPGLLSADGGSHYKNLNTYLGEKGYTLHAQTLDASDYGVLQNRKRVIIVGWRNDFKLGFPEIEKHEKTWKIENIFSDLPKLKPGEDKKVAKYASKTNDYLEKYEIRNGIDYVTHNIARPHNERDLDIYKYAINQWNTGGIRLKYTDLPEELRTHKNTESFLDRFKVVDSKGVSHTVVAHIAKDGHYYIHPDIEQCRSISIREAARIQSFPDDFYFEGSRTAAFKQIGNAVPPLLSQSIAKSIKKMLEQN
jgi:DNA (cytosine-5)-methyltransferase 1